MCEKMSVLLLHCAGESKEKEKFLIQDMLEKMLSLSLPKTLF